MLISSIMFLFSCWMSLGRFNQLFLKMAKERNQAMVGPPNITKAGNQTTEKCLPLQVPPLAGTRSSACLHLGFRHSDRTRL